jgi:fructose-1,6-bisphosphatase/inositol monophosphatase family enzyme
MDATGFPRLLEAVVPAVREAGALLLRDFSRPGGPVGSGGHAEADGEAEEILRARLLAAAPGFGYLGEETGAVRRPGAPWWCVDPNDGTKWYLQGRRGSAVSVALVRDSLPVLGVVFAFAAPGGGEDLVAWAEGGEVTRNGVPVPRPAPAAVGASDAPPPVILLSPAAEGNLAANRALAAPGTTRLVPSIAYRLALVAAGDGDLAVTLNTPSSWDLAGGHALLRGAGLDLWRCDGAPVRYREGSGAVGSPFVFGGAEALARTYLERPWERALR